MEQDNPQTKEIRERVVFFLLLMTSEKALEACQDIIPQEKLAFELCRIWFDEIYTPGLSYINDSLKGDYSEAKVRQFEEAFDVEELIELERFHRFFELRMEMLQKKLKDAASFPESDMWWHLVKHATYLLELREPRVANLRTLFENNIREAVESQENFLAASKWQNMLQE